MSKKVLLLVFFLTAFLAAGLVWSQTSIQAVDTLEQLEQEKNELQHLLDLSAAATKPLEAEVKAIEDRINKAKADLKAAQIQATHLGESIKQRELDMGSQYQVFSHRVLQQYKRSASNTPFLTFLSSSDATNLARNLAYQSSVESQDHQIITSIGTEITQLESDKKNLEQTQVKLAGLQTQLDTQAAFFNKEIKGAKAYQADLSGKIAVLSAKQQDIINARSGSFTTSVGDVPLADDFNASIAFKAQAPANSFAVFSFGAFTHRNGMSQYGAKARGEAGQSPEQILQAYFPGAQLKKDYSAPDQITVNGYGSMSFEGRYLQSIGEMPSSWNGNALRAQAVASRTFALSRTNNLQKSMCTGESCQVFLNSPKGGEWEKAVNDTRNWVLVDGSGKPISAMYASTHGGYSATVHWDTSDGSGDGNWSSRAWESKANSPWFYKAWYTQAYSVNSAKCGRNHPWLSQEEFSDIINAWIVRKNPNGADVGRIQPITINSCSVGGSGGNPYSMEELRNLANGSGGAVTNVSSVSVSNNGSAITTTVTLQTNRGTISIPGDEFKSTFNLRAPGYLSIPQKSFSFFNIEHKD